MNKYKVTSNQPAFVLDEDDLPIGRVLGRREVLTLFGVTSSALLLNACVPATGEAAPDLAAIAEANANLPSGCVVRPELTEGPVFVEDDLNRSDIRTDPSNGAISEGAQLDLTFRVSSIVDNACSPLAGAQVDIWQCDVNGIYSDTAELEMNTVGQKFLRGHQITDENGMVKFTTIYPGWYEGRAVHIHAKIRTDDGYDFTSQLFFDDKLTDEVFAQAPYNSRGERLLRNDDDGIFEESDGQMMLSVNKTDIGYATAFDVALDLS